MKHKKSLSNIPKKKIQDILTLRDFTIFISFHQANSIERKYLFRCCIRSAMAQGCKVVLIHDNSSNSEELEFARIHGVLLHEMENIPDVGISKFLKAFDLCETKYLSFLQDDDWYDLDKTKKIISALNSVHISNPEKEFALITTDIRIIENGIQKGIWTSRNQFLVPPSKWVINKEIIKSIDPTPDYPWGWDKAIAFQLLSKGHILHLAFPLTYYNFHEEQATHKAKSENTDENMKIVENYIKSLKLNEILIFRGEDIKIAKQSRIITSLVNFIKNTKIFAKLKEN